MNVLKGNIEQFEVSEELSLVYVKVQDYLLTAIVIDTPATASYLEMGHPVDVIFKETEVVLGVGDQPISLQNQLKGEVVSIIRGDLISKIELQTSVGKITSIITTNAVNKLRLQLGTEVVAMVKTNEIMLSYDDIT